MGSGLGIGIAKSIISKLGYKLKIQSQVEKGSEFTVIIPNPIKKDSNNFKNLVKSRRSSISEKTKPIFSCKYSDDSMIKDSSFVLNSLQNCFFSIPFQENENANQNYESENLLNSCSNLKILEEKKSMFRRPNYSVDLYKYKNCDCSLGYNHKIKKYLDSQFPSINIVKKPTTKPIKTVTFNTSNGGFHLNTNNIVYSSLNYHSDTSPNKNIILIVDDANMIRQSVKKVILANKFVSENFDLLEANDGIDMLSLVIHHQNNGNYIKLIITDENMEYMCGSTAIEIIRQLEKEKKIRRVHVVSLTAFSDEETINEIYNKGADKIFFKPLSNKTFNEFISLNINTITG